MASITVRNIPDNTKHQLRVQAAEAGQSLEGFVRNLLDGAAKSKTPKKESLMDIVQECFESEGVDLDISRSENNRPTIDFR